MNWYTYLLVFFFFILFFVVEFYPEQVLFDISQTDTYLLEENNGLFYTTSHETRHDGDIARLREAILRENVLFYLYIFISLHVHFVRKICVSIS